MSSRPPPLKLNTDVNNASADVDVRKACPQVYDQVLITDNEDVARWASKDTFLFRMFHFLHQFGVIRLIIDGFCEVNPTWQIVLLVDDIIDKQQPVYVGDTLVLHCDSTNSYEKIIPFICGPYSRLVLHGNINVNQVKELTTPNVKKVRIDARMDVPENDHDDFAEFVANQTCAFNPCFTISSKSLTPKTYEKLHKACRSKKRLSYPSNEGNDRNFHVTNFGYIMWIMFLHVSFMCPIFYFEQGDELIKYCIFYPYLFSSLLFTMATVIAICFPDCIPKMDTLNASVVQSNDIRGLIYAIIRALWAPIDTELLNMCDIFA